MSVLLLAALLPTAEASGYYILDPGTRAIARGGAFVAGVDDLSAQYWNPAGLMNLDRPQAFLNFSMVAQPTTFSRVDYGADGSVAAKYDPVSNGAPAMPIPAIAVSHNFGLKKWNFAFGLYPPFAPRFDYPEEGAQRYNLQDSTILQAWTGPSVAWRPVKWLKIGVGASWTFFDVRQTRALLVCNSTLSTDGLCPYDAATELDGSYGRQNDVQAVIDVKDMVKFTWNAGVIVEPKPWIAIGASVLPPIKVNANGSFTTKFGKDHWLGPNSTDPVVSTLFPDGVLNGDTFADNDATVSLQMPLILRGGVALRPKKGLEFEVATVYQRWSMTDQITISDLNLTLDLEGELAGEPLDDVVIEDNIELPLGWVDTWSVRVGGDWDINPEWTVRAGAHWEQGAVPPLTLGVDAPDADKYGYGLGAAYTIQDRVIIDLSWGHTLLGDVTIPASDARRLEVPVNLQQLISEDNYAPAIENGLPIGTGSLNAQSMMGSAGVTVLFGKAARGGDGGPGKGGKARGKKKG